MENQKETYFQKVKRVINEWASDDFFVPAFIMGTGCSEEILSHVTVESPQSESFLADRDSISLRPDLLIISGLINFTTLELIKKEYNNLVGRKYVVIVGSHNKNIHQLNSYNIVNNLEDHIPVDLLIPGSSPSRAEIIAGLNQLKDIRR